MVSSRGRNSATTICASSSSGAQRNTCPRLNAARSAGLLCHVTGADEAFFKSWGRSLDCQVMEGAVGDFFGVGTQVSAPVQDGSRSSLRSGNITTVGDSNGI